MESIPNLGTFQGQHSRAIGIHLSIINCSHPKEIIPYTEFLPTTISPKDTAAMSLKTTYTDEQLEVYLKRIGYPGPDTDLLHDLRQRIEKDAFAVLCDLQRRHLAAVPWGNSGLHYTQHHTISLNALSLFEKMVERRLDGYCMENTGIFLVVLRSLGYLVYATGGRVSHAAAKGVDNGLYLSM
jgi:hypothetical protein